MSKVLLREFHQLCPDGICNIGVLNESEQKMVKNGQMILSGICHVCDEKNFNGRIYPRNVLEREMKNYDKVIRENRAYGELSHSDKSEIDLKNASHRMLRMWWNGNNIMGTILVLPTPTGQTLRALVESGGTVGISSRGLGSLQETKYGNIVGDDYAICCFDVVDTPSTPGAYMKVNESQEKALFTKADRLYRILNSITTGDK